jgi:hypothetical protein
MNAMTMDGGVDNLRNVFCRNGPSNRWMLQLMFAYPNVYFGAPTRVTTVQHGGSLAGKLSIRLSSTMS